MSNFLERIITNMRNDNASNEDIEAVIDYDKKEKQLNSVVDLNQTSYSYNPNQNDAIDPFEAKDKADVPKEDRKRIQKYLRGELGWRQYRSAKRDGTIEDLIQTRYNDEITKKSLEQEQPVVETSTPEVETEPEVSEGKTTKVFETEEKMDEYLTKPMKGTLPEVTVSPKEEEEKEDILSKIDLPPEEKLDIDNAFNTETVEEVTDRNKNLDKDTQGKSDPNWFKENITTTVDEELKTTGSVTNYHSELEEITNNYGPATLFIREHVTDAGQTKFVVYPNIVIAFDQPRIDLEAIDVDNDNIVKNDGKAIGYFNNDNDAFGYNQINGLYKTFDNEEQAIKYVEDYTSQNPYFINPNQYDGDKYENFMPTDYEGIIKPVQPTTIDFPENVKEQDYFEFNTTGGGNLVGNISYYNNYDYFQEIQQNTIDYNKTKVNYDDLIKSKKFRKELKKVDIPKTPYKNLHEILSTVSNELDKIENGLVTRTDYVSNISSGRTKSVKLLREKLIDVYEFIEGAYELGKLDVLAIEDEIKEILSIYDDINEYHVLADKDIKHVFNNGKSDYIIDYIEDNYPNLAKNTDDLIEFLVYNKDKGNVLTEWAKDVGNYINTGEWNYEQVDFDEKKLLDYIFSIDPKKSLQDMPLHDKDGSSYNARNYKFLKDLGINMKVDSPAAKLLILEALKGIISYKWRQYEGAWQDFNSMSQKALSASYDWKTINDDGLEEDIVISGYQIMEELKNTKAFVDSLPSKYKKLKELNIKSQPIKEIMDGLIETYDNIDRKIFGSPGDNGVWGDEDDIYGEFQLLTMPQVVNGIIVPMTDIDKEKVFNKLNLKSTRLKKQARLTFEKENQELLFKNKQLQEEWNSYTKGVENLNKKIEKAVLIKSMWDGVNEFGEEHLLKQNIRDLDAYKNIIGTKPINNKMEAEEVMSQSPATLLVELYDLENVIKRLEADLDAAGDDSFYIPVLGKFGGQLSRLINLVAISDPVREKFVSTKTDWVVEAPFSSIFGGAIMGEKGTFELNGNTYTIYTKDGQVQGVLDSNGDLVTVKSFGGNYNAYFDFQENYLNKINNEEISLEDYFAAGAFTEVATVEVLKMWAVIQTTGGLGYLAESAGLGATGIRVSQGAFQFLFYGTQSYENSKQVYLNANPGDYEGASDYAFINGAITGIIAQINVEGRLGGSSLSKEAIDRLSLSFASNQTMKLSKSEFVKEVSRGIGLMIAGETVEEISELYLQKVVSDYFDNTKAGGEYNLLDIDITPKDLLEMQLLVTTTAGVMGGKMTYNKLKGIQKGNFDYIMSDALKVLKEDPDFTSLKLKLKQALDNTGVDGNKLITQEQYDNAILFFNDLSAIKTKLDKEKGAVDAYNDTEYKLLLNLSFQKKSLERNDDGKSQEQLNIELERVNGLIKSVKQGDFFATAKDDPNSRYNIYHAVKQTGEYQLKLVVLLKTLFPNINDFADQIQEIQNLIDQNNEMGEESFKKNNPEGHKTLEDFKKQEQTIFDESQESLQQEAISYAKKTGKDHTDQEVLDRIKIKFLINKEWDIGIHIEEKKHREQIAENQEKFDKLKKRKPDVVNSKTTNEEFEKIIDACVTDRQKVIVQKIKDRIRVYPDLEITLYYDGKVFDLETNNGELTGGSFSLSNNTASINLEHAKSNVGDHEINHYYLDNLKLQQPDLHRVLTKNILKYIRQNPLMAPYIEFGRISAEAKGYKITDPEFNATLEDEAVVEFLSDLQAGEIKIDGATKNSLLKGVKKLLSNVRGKSLETMSYDQVLDYIADMTSEYTNMPLYDTPINPGDIEINPNQDNKNSVNIGGKRQYVLTVDGKETNLGEEINKIYAKEGMAAWPKIELLVRRILQNEAQKARKNSGPFNLIPGFDLDNFIFTSLYGSDTRAFESIFETAKKFDPETNDDFFGFMMTKGSNIFLPQMLDAMKSGDVVTDLPTDFDITPADPDIDPDTDTDLDPDDDTGKVTLIEGIDLDTDFNDDGKTKNYKTELDAILIRLLTGSLPDFRTQVSKNRIKTHPFTSYIVQQVGDPKGKSGQLRLNTQLFLGKGGDTYRNNLIKYKSVILNNLSTTYLSRNIPQLVEKFVVGEGWTLDWKGKKIKRDGNNQMMRTVKDPASKIDDNTFVSIYMNTKPGKKEGDPPIYSRIQGKGEGLEYQLAGEIALQTLYKELKDPKSEIRKRWDKVYGDLSNEILTESEIATIGKMMERGDDKLSVNIIKLNADPIKWTGLWTSLDDISKALKTVPNSSKKAVVGTKKKPGVIADILSKVVDDNGDLVFTNATERINIANDIFDLIKNYDNVSAIGQQKLTVTDFSKEIVSSKMLFDNLIKKFDIRNKDGKLVTASELFDDLDKVKKQRFLPFDMAKDLIDGGMPKLQVVKLLLKHYKAQYTSAGKIGRGVIAIDKKTGDLVVIDKKTKGLTQRYQVFENVNDYIKNVVNKIPGVNVNSNGVGTIDGVDVNIDTKGVTQTVNSRRKSTYQENLDAALESEQAIRTQLGWLANEIKNPDSSYTEEDFVMLLMSYKSNMNTILRAAANLKYDSGITRNVVYEHVIPAEIVCQVLADYYLRPGTITDAQFDTFFENYTVAIIPKGMDDMLKTFKRNSSMPGTWEVDVDALIRYYDDVTIQHPDLVPLVDLSTNELVGDAFTTVKNTLDIKAINSEKLSLDIKSKNVAFDVNVIKSDDKLSVKPFSETTLRIFDFDETLIIGGDNIVKIIAPDGTTEDISSEDFAKRVGELTEAGYTFNFDDFVNVKGGDDGPMLEKLRNQIERYGSKNVRILTARQPESAIAIHEWLKSKGINLPIENITGLGVSVDGQTKTITGEDKAIEIKKYINEGFVDIEMYDDSKSVVDAVNGLQNEFNIKVEGIQVYEDFKNSINVVREQFLDILKLTKGIDPENLPTALQSQIKAAKMFTFGLYGPGSFDFRDFVYSFLPKGEEGIKARAWFEKMIIEPYDRGVSDFKKAKIKLNERYKNLLKNLPEARKDLNNKVPGTEFTTEHAVRVWIWNELDYNIPDITPEELQTLLDHVNSNEDLKAFATGVKATAGEYTKPGAQWVGGTIASDLIKLGTEFRGKYLTEWKENMDLMFTDDVRSTLRSVYGQPFLDAFENITYRMEYGTNIPQNTSNRVRKWNNWVNNSVGAIMFFNMRSAALQLISTFNYLDFNINSPMAAAGALAQPVRFAKTLNLLLNDSYIKTRLGTEGRGIAESEIAALIKSGKANVIEAIVARLLKLGFTPTKIADMLAITLGGTSFVMNYQDNYMTQINPITGELYTEPQALEKALADWRAKSEESQQSADPSRISEDQASVLGHWLLNFKNTPMQYFRILRRASSDLMNGRTGTVTLDDGTEYDAGTTGEKIARIAYFGVIQSALFTFLQSAVFAKFDQDDEEFDETLDAWLQSTIDNVLGGMGLQGQVIVTVKNGIIEYEEQKDKGWNADHTYTILQLLNVSPAIGSKLRKIYSGIKTMQINEGIMDEFDFGPGHPEFDAMASVIEGFTNIPTDRINRILRNIIASSDSEIEVWQRFCLLFGWNTWDLGVETEAQAIRREQKEIKNKAKEKEKEKKKKKDLQKLLEDEVVKPEVEQYEKDKAEGKIETDKDGYPTNKTYYCSNINKNNKRCGAVVKKPGDKCTYHEDVEMREDGKKTRCTFIKSKGGQCGNMTAAKSGLCPVHD